MPDSGKPTCASPRFEAFIARLDQVRDDVDIALVLRDLTPGRRKYLAQNVVARISHEPDCPEGYVALRVRSPVGREISGPWWVRIVRVLPARLPGSAYSSADKALQAEASDSARE
jgi:hypothetical protein